MKIQFHTSSYLVQGHGGLVPLPAVIEQETGNTLYRSSPFHRANTESQTTIHTCWMQFRITYLHVFGHANSTQSDSIQGGIEPTVGPSCCEESVLTTTPLSPMKLQLKVQNLCPLSHFSNDAQWVGFWPPDLIFDTPGLEKQILYCTKAFIVALQS